MMIEARQAIKAADRCARGVRRDGEGQSVYRAAAGGDMGRVEVHRFA
jgi:hypothetical protein